MTKILIISDVHSNIIALEAVLADAGSIDETWCLGDVVGYGPNPNECINRIRELPNLTCLMGNHDLAAIGTLGLETFNTDARRSLIWQKENLSTESLEFLRDRPNELQVRGQVSLVHGSPRDPVWEYILNSIVAFNNLEHFQTQWCFVGHSHFQVGFHYIVDENEVIIEKSIPGSMVHLTERAILNPGSVGQPRDHDPRAAYAIFDPELRTWLPKRVDYDILEIQSRILTAGLPAKHAERLKEGW